MSLTNLDAKTSFQNLILILQYYWSKNGCAIIQPFDMEVGAATFHPATFLRSIGPEPFKAVYAQASRRPTDGRYGENPNRLQHYYQMQVLIKPSPDNIQELYLKSLENIGIDLKNNDIRFVEDNWESPTLGASGIGWEVWLNGMEISQFTYFQKVGGMSCKPIPGELTYGLERLAMHLQKTSSVYDIAWNDDLSYKDLFKQNEIENSQYNFNIANTDYLFKQFDEAEDIHTKLIEKNLPLPSYEQVIKASHLFNLLDSRKSISATDRIRFILRVRAMSQKTAKIYYDSRKKLNFPLLNTKNI